MKSLPLQLLSSLVLFIAIPVMAADDKDKDKDKPQGRVITIVEPHLEFLVTKDRKVEIIALTKDLKPTKLTGQVIAVTAGDRSKPTKLEFKEEDGKLLSNNTLPEGNDYPVSVSIKPGAGGKAVYEKFNLNLEKCPTCKHQEYACVCEHSKD